jgi:hypothetical protein
LELSIGSNQDQGLLSASQKCENLKHRLRLPFFVVLEFWETLLKTVKKALCEFFATINESNTASEGLFVLLSGSGIIRGRKG